VIDAQQMQNRRVQIVVGDGLLLGFVAEVVGRADGLATSDARPGHPDRHRARVVIAADASLRDRHAAEFGVPDHEGRIEETTRLQIGEQRGNRAVRFGGVLRVVRFQVAVRVPRVRVLVAHPSVEELHEADAALDESPRHEALPAEWLGDRVVESVQLSSRL
jgi:hypothetical protein